MSKDGGKDGKPYSPADMHGAMDSLQRKMRRTGGVKSKGTQHPDNKKLNLTVGEAMGPGIAHKDGLKDAQKTDSMKAYYAQVERDQAARGKKIEQERKDGIRSKYESVEQVDELKRDTLGSYADKAQGDIEGIGNVLKAKGKQGPVSAKHRAELERELRNRVKGRKRAIGKKYTREDVEQVDELKMPEKDKRGRAKDPVIGAALERGSRRADLKAHGKLRRGDTDGAEGHMTRSRKRQAASRTPVEEAKVGDTVHLGHATKGGLSLIHI